MTAQSRAGSLVLAACLLGVGALVPSHPVAAAAVVPVAVLGILLARAAATPALFVRALGALLAGYMFLGRGFAYLGQRPIFVGELVLVLALLTILATARSRQTTGLHGLLLAFMLLGAARTLPYLHEYGSEALRDGTLWGYGLFAYAVSFGVDAEGIGRGLRFYRRLVPFFLAWVPLAGAIAMTHVAPVWPNSGVPLVEFKGGDYGVHLSMVTAFVLVGLYGLRRAPARRSDFLLWGAWAAGVVFTIVVSRAAILALSTIIAVVALLHWSPRIFKPLAALVVAVVLLLVVNPSVQLGNGLVVSPAQIGSNLVSIVMNTNDETTTASGPAVLPSSSVGDQQLQGSKNFRVAWWKTIWNYTVNGPYFWAGKGFGVNLADSDGFQVTDNDSLRAPHNTHMTVLARMGVPGFVLWIVLQSAFAAMLLGAWKRARDGGAPRCAQLDLWLFAGWLAMMVNTSFDPYLEGPQGSIWFWVLVGAGIVSIRDQRRDLESFEAGLERGDPTEAVA